MTTQNPALSGWTMALGRFRDSTDELVSFPVPTLEADLVLALPNTTARMRRLAIDRTGPALSRAWPFSVTIYDVERGEVLAVIPAGNPGRVALWEGRPWKLQDWSAGVVVGFALPSKTKIQIGGIDLRRGRPGLL